MNKPILEEWQEKLTTELSNIAFHHLPKAKDKSVCFGTCIEAQQKIKEAIKAVREATIAEAVNLVDSIYDAKYQYVTRDYRTEDKYRDDMRKALTNLLKTNEK